MEAKYISVRFPCSLSFQTCEMTKYIGDANNQVEAKVIQIRHEAGNLTSAQPQPQPQPQPQIKKKKQSRREMLEHWKASRLKHKIKEETKNIRPTWR